MPLNRRQLITTPAATAVATGATSRWATAATPDRHRVPAARGGHYSPNPAPLHPTDFLKLPQGKVTAHGWLAGQLKLQLEGLCGRYEEFSHFLDFTATGWVRPDKGGWEEVPYSLRGYADLAIVTGDATALATTRRWMDAILATGQSDGFFGPKALRTSLNGGPDFWPFLPLIQALRSWQEYTEDNRIIPFLSRFFRFRAWCADPDIRVNGQRVAAPAGPAFTRIERTWSSGDRVTLRLPQRTTVRSWAENHGSVSVDHGPLTMTARARRIPEWTADDEHVVAPLQPSPARSTEPVEEVTLVPMGAARLRITSFPTAAPDAEPWLADRWYRIANRHSGKVLGVDGMSTADSAHVVQYDGNGTADHLWRLL